MNFDDSDSYKKSIEKNTRQRRAVMISIVFCALLVVLLFFLIATIKHKDAITMKMFLNGTQVNIPSGLIKDYGKDGKYLDIKIISEMLGYEYTLGEYNKYNEDPASCYFQDKAEIVAITADKNYYTKYLEFSSDYQFIKKMSITAKNPNGYKELFFVNKKVKLDKDRLYVSVEELPRMLNISLDWNNEYRLKINTLPNVVSSVIQKKVSKAGYTVVSGYFENYKAMLDGFAVVKSKENDLFGIYSIDSGKLIVGTKYDDIKYIQSIKSFYIKANNAMGLVDSTGANIIDVKNGYSEISLLDEEEQLYLVKKDSQFGVVNKNGEEVIYPEYDKIGIDISKFNMDDITNGNLLYGKYIPYYTEVSDGVFKYGLLDKDGNIIEDFWCDDFGYKSVNNSASATRDRDTLLIPESVGMRGIIYRSGDGYGIFDADKARPTVPASFLKIYLAVKEGQTEYYVESQADGKILLSDYLKENNLSN